MQYSPLADTWRTQAGLSYRETSRGALMAYLNPFAVPSEEKPNHRRVMDRADLQLLLPGVIGRAGD